jgi:uncharacterized protein YceH (UPF0502 family)
MLNLNVNEVRVLGALIEKEITTPEYYPLSLNALVNACNQKSSREPVMALSEADVRTALFEMEGMGLVRVLNESRATKFEHLMYSKLDLRRPEIAMMGLMMLRGAQTPAELRSRAERLYTFDDTGAVLAVLERLAAREDALTIQMERQPGSKERRWMHLMGGPVDPGVPLAEAVAGNARSAAVSAVNEELMERVAFLEEAVQALEERIASLEAAKDA